MPQVTTETVRALKVKTKDGRTLFRIEELAPATQDRDREFIFRVNLPYNTSEEQAIANQFHQQLLERCGVG